MLHVVEALFFRELKTRFGANRHLGYLWVVGQPMFQIAVILLIVTAIREYRHQVMPSEVSIFMFLACGIIPFFMFRNMLTQLMNGIQGNMALFAYKPVRPIHVFIARTFLEFCIHFVIFVSLLFLASWFFHIKVLPDDFLGVLFCISLLILSGFTIGMCFAIIGHLIEPLKILLTYVGVLLYIMSAVMYPVWILPKSIIDILLYNPLLHIMENLKIHYFANYPITEGINYTYPILFNIVLLFVALWFYHYKQKELLAVNTK